MTCGFDVYTLNILCYSSSDMHNAICWQSESRVVSKLLVIKFYYVPFGVQNQSSHLPLYSKITSVVVGESWDRPPPPPHGYMISALYSTTTKQSTTNPCAYVVELLKCGSFMMSTLSSVAAPDVIMTTSGAANDDIVDIMNIGFQWHTVSREPCTLSILSR